MGHATSIPIPVALRNMLESGSGVLFVGAGIGWSAFAADGKPMPDGKQLAIELSKEFCIAPSDSNLLSKVAQVVQLRHGRDKLISFLSKRLAGHEPNEHLRWIFSLRWKAIFTTNYDFVIQRCYEISPTPPQNAVTISCASRLMTYDPRFDVPLYHLHGCLFDDSGSQILITSRDYDTFAERRRMLFEVLKRECATSTFLYIGYGNQDPNWASVLSEMQQEFLPATPPYSFRVAQSTDALDKEILAAQKIETIDATVDDFAMAAQAVVDAKAVHIDRSASVRASIPRGLADAFDANPAATLRLLNSWEYVNEAEFGDDPKALAFIEGNQPNWATVAQAHTFARDVEPPVIDTVLDFCTSPKPGHGQLIILGPAGFGITTALMRVAFAIVHEKAAMVLRLRTGAAVGQGDVEFACTMATQSVVFIVDNAADHAHALRAAVIHLRSRRLPHFLLLGERLNEWRSSPVIMKPVEYGIDALSETEIERLLAFLDEHDALNKLKELKPELRAAAIRQKHDRQLLVAMKEATEGAAFSAIIEDEFRSLASDQLQQMYAIVACAYSNRRLLRDSLLAQVLGTNVIEMYRELAPGLDGVVLFECVDDARGLYAARCRHHAIAEIVWERCVLPGEREHILQEIVRHLNLAYFQDAQLFESIIRDDRQVDGLGSLEGKIGFFEWACKKDPESPYVRQHYARMLQREKRYELALAQINTAIQLRPNTRVLYHSKGVILRDMALDTEGIEVARRRLAQGEACFREAIGRDDRDTYAYQSLAELYLGWAKRCSDPSEQAMYMAKCEETIGEGLIRARHRDELWIVSAKVQKWIGNQPGAIESLKRAGSSPVARYLLGRAYSAAGEFAAARTVLEEVLAVEPEQYRAAICYALCILGSGESYAAALAPLRLAELYGLRDPQFIAMLGGLLFLTGEFSESTKVFQLGSRGDLPVEDRRRIWFWPGTLGKPDLPLRMDGTISGAEAGHSWISVPGIPRVLAAVTHIAGRPVRRGEAVSFQIAFSAEGPLGVRLSRVR